MTSTSKFRDAPLGVLRQLLLVLIVLDGAGCHSPIRSLVLCLLGHYVRIVSIKC